MTKVVLLSEQQWKRLPLLMADALADALAEAMRRDGFCVWEKEAGKPTDWAHDYLVGVLAISLMQMESEANRIEVK